MQDRANKSLMRIIRKPLNLCEQSTDTAINGYVYIVSRGPDEDCYKIGFSRYHPRARVSRHRKCYDTVRLVAHTNIIHHARRVEQLAHLDLSKHRRRDHCDRCSRLHREWFNISEDMAIETVSKWASWIASQPYKAQSGRLKSFWLRRLDSVARKPWNRHYSESNLGKDWTDSWKGDRGYISKLEPFEESKIHRYDGHEVIIERLW